MKDGHQIFSIAARSHDLKPMENIFHILQKKLQLVALEMKIERKDFEKSSAQVKKKKKILESIPVDVMDKTIRSTDGRIDFIVKIKVQRIRYQLLMFFMDLHNYFYSIQYMLLFPIDI